MVADGITVDEIVAELPPLEHEDVRAALRSPRSSSAHSHLRIPDLRLRDDADDARVIPPSCRPRLDSALNAPWLAVLPI